MNVLLRTLSALTLVAAVGTAHAVDYKNEFDKKVKATQNIGALGDNLAGDSVNFYNGVTSFSATDASLPGNNALSVAVSRRYDVEFDHDLWRPFGDWELDLPYITTVMSDLRGWVVGPSGSENRCNVSSVADATPPYVTVAEDTGLDKTQAFLPFEYWHGYTLHMPGGGDQAMLLASSGAPLTVPAVTYRWTTNKDWWLSCIPAVSGGGEGFLAISPDGTKYTFNHMAGRGTDALEKTVNDVDGPNPGGQNLYFTLDRAEFRMMPSRVEDRFGNWVEYDWVSGQLTKIRSSDLREITLGYYPSSHLVQTVTDGTRTWTYTYANGSLSRVTQSDLSYWEYNFAGVNALRRPQPACFANFAQPNFDCYGGGYISAPPPTVATVRHPSGAQAAFTFEVHFQPSNSSGWLGYYPLSLREKTISGPGLAAATWKYGIVPTMEQTRTACRAGACPTRLVTDELAPDNSLVRRVFGLTKLVDESLLLGELHGNALATTSAAGTLPITTSARWTEFLDDASPITGTVPVFYKEVDSRYVPSTDVVDYQRVVGTNPFTAGDMGFSAQRQPIKERILTQQGAKFTRTTTDFNEFAQPEAVTSKSEGLAGIPNDEFGSPVTGFTRYEKTFYRHDKAKWVIGQVQKTSVGPSAATQIEVARTEYDSASNLPAQAYSYQLLQQAFTYNSNGTLGTVADAAGNVTQLSIWKRGVPSQIRFPDTTAGLALISAEINNLGNLDWTKNEYQKVTSYTYDSMGRLAMIGYPAESAFAWNPLLRSFVFEGISEEYGIPAGHWRQTVSTGTGKATTFYDARWNPVLTLTEDSANALTKSFVVRRFDAMGREVFASYPVDSATVNSVLFGVVTEYDALGRPYRTKQDSELPNGAVLISSTEYLPGFQTRVTNPRGYRSVTSYKAFGEPNTDMPVRIDTLEGAEKVRTEMTRDIFGKPTAITRSGPGG